MKTVKIRLNNKEVEALYNMIFGDVVLIDPKGLGNMLVLEILTEVYTQLQKMMWNDEQKRFTLKLSPAQQVAMLIYSTTINDILYPFEAMMFRRIVEQVDKNINNNIK